MWKSKVDHAGNARQDDDISPPDVEDPLPRPKTLTGLQSNMASQRSTFPETLPPRPQPSNDRRCPGARFCWSFDWQLWSLNTGGDTAELVRRICMWVTLGVRTATSILGLILRLYGVDIGGLVIGIILAVIGFFFIAWCLAGIGSAQGSWRVLGVVVNRWHFDVFLLGSAIIHVGIIFIVVFARSQPGYFVTWYGMWILIFVAKWITTWTPEPQSYV